MFNQKILHGEQVEERDDWLEFGDPWEKLRAERKVTIQLNGRVVKDEKGHSKWVDTQVRHYRRV